MSAPAAHPAPPPRPRKAWYQRRFIRRLAERLGPLAQEQLRMREKFGYWPRARRPRSLREKLLRRRFLDSNPLFPTLADKFAVRDIIRRLDRTQHLVPLLASATSFEELPWDSLPDSFVLKANHGSGWNYFVRDKSAADRDALRTLSATWLASTWGLPLREWWYAPIPPRLLVEPVLIDRTHGRLIDYRFHCFRGRVAELAVEMDLTLPTHRHCRYSPEWLRLPAAEVPGRIHGPDLPRPARLNDMVALAEHLSAGVLPDEYIRVDLYCPNDEQIYFSEFTLAPSAGDCRFILDNATDFRLGKLW